MTLPQDNVSRQLSDLAVGVRHDVCVGWVRAWKRLEVLEVEQLSMGLSILACPILGPSKGTHNLLPGHLVKELCGFVQTHRGEVLVKGIGKGFLQFVLQTSIPCVDAG
jgi:hypothetical protein